MKNTKRFPLYILSALIVMSTSSCLIVNGKESTSTKRGWTKNTNNPHNPNTTNPGKAKGHHK